MFDRGVRIAFGLVELSEIERRQGGEAEDGNARINRHLQRRGLVVEGETAIETFEGAGEIGGAVARGAAGEVGPHLQRRQPGPLGGGEGLVGERACCLRPVTVQRRGPLPDEDEDQADRVAEPHERRPAAATERATRWILVVTCRADHSSFRCEL